MNITQEQHKRADTNNINTHMARFKNTEKPIENRGIEKIIIKPLEDKYIKPVITCKTQRIIGYRRTEKEENPFETKEDIFEELLFMIFKPVIEQIGRRMAFVSADLEKRFGDQLSLTYSGFMKQIEETADISNGDDLTFVIIYAHGNGRVKEPYVRIEKEKVEYKNLLDKLDKIKGVKVLLILSCGSGRIKDILEERENKEDYWVITSSEGKKRSFDPTCRKPWKILECPGDTLEEKFEEFKNQFVAKVSAKATYIKGRNIQF